MPNRKSTPRRNFLKIAFSTGFSAPGGFAFAQPFPFMGKKFEWLPSECADVRYPMQLIEGIFYSDNRPIAKAPAGKITNKGWGAPGSIHIVGPTLKAVPERLDLSWFSFTEDQFFEGTIPLPSKTITALFEEGFKDAVTGAQETWTKILVGMGLGGWTSVWLLGGSGIVREIATTQLKPTQLNWAWVLDNPAIERSTFVRTILQRRLSKSEINALAKHGPPVSTWPRYAQRYRWRIDVAGKHAPLYMFLRSFNGERQGYDFVRSPPGVLETVPKNIQITWLSNKGHKLLSEIHLDETEVYDVLDQANPAASNMTTTLRIEFDARYQISIVLESQAIRIPLTRSRVEVSSYGT